MKVIFLTKYGYGGASSRYRSYHYRKYFSDFRYEFHPLLSDNYITELNKADNSKILLFYYSLSGIFKRIFYLLFSSSSHFYIIEKELFPNLPYFFERLLLLNKKYSLDYDDYVGTSYSTKKIKRIFLKNKLQQLVSKSQLTTVGNKWYFEIFNHHPSLYYLPTNIEAGTYKKFVRPDTERIHHNNFRIVWIGSKFTSNYLEIFKEAFFKLAAKYDVSLDVIGGIPPFQHHKVKSIKWDEATEIQNISYGDVGIMPLYDTLWEKGKCGFKLIQYMGVGLPVVSSPSPANKEIIKDNGFICNSPEEWYEKLEFLILNREKRLKMGEKSLSRVEQFYSYENWGPVYAALINEKANNFN